MQLYKVRLRPLAPWVTPWQSDTLSGLLCWTYARTRGAQALREDVISPALSGQPVFVLSDAFPAGLLPVPRVVQLLNWLPEHRKKVKVARWMLCDAFRALQEGAHPSLDDLDIRSPFRTVPRLHNTISRITQTTGDGGSLFMQEETSFLADARNHELEIYIRIEPGFKQTIEELFHALAETGFGADTSVGAGSFEIVSGVEPCPELDNGKGKEGAVSLSTFQPGPEDPIRGAWEAFVKFGKLGPDFGLGNVFKRPLLLFRPGACFTERGSRNFFGRAIKMEEVLAPDVALELRNRGVEIVHLAFGLSVPAQLNNFGLV